MRDRILKAALGIAEKRGLRRLRRRDIAMACKIAPPTVTYYFGSMDELRAAVIGEALDSKVWPVVAAAIVEKHPLVKDLPLYVRQRALRSLA